MEDIIEERETELPNVIVLNVGGTIYTTTKATLHRDRSSMLAALFSGRYKIPIDPNGRFFIDRDGQNFSFILAYLRGESCHPPAHLAVKILEEAEYFQIHGLIEALQVYPSVFQGKLFKRIDEKFNVQFWKREIVKQSQEKCLESLTMSSRITFISEDLIELMSEEPSCVLSQHSILITKATKQGPKYSEETFDQLAKRLKTVDCMIKDVSTKDLDVFVASLQRQLDVDKYKYQLAEETATCRASNGYKNKDICDFAIKYFHIELFWNDNSLGANDSTKFDE